MSQSYSEREKRMALITGGFLALALLYTTGIEPGIDSYKTSSNDLAEARDAVHRAERVRRVNKPYKRQLRQLEKTLKQAEAARFWKALEAGLLERQLTLVSSSQGSGEKKVKAGYQVVRYSLTLTGSLTSMMSMLQLFQQAEGFLRAQTISLNKRSGIFTASVTVSTLIPLDGKEDK